MVVEASLADLLEGKVVRKRMAVTNYIRGMSSISGMGKMLLEVLTLVDDLDAMLVALFDWCLADT